MGIVTVFFIGFYLKRTTIRNNLNWLRETDPDFYTNYFKLFIKYSECIFFFHLRVPKEYLGGKITLFFPDRLLHTPRLETFFRAPVYICSLILSLWQGLDLLSTYIFPSRAFRTSLSSK